MLILATSWYILKNKFNTETYMNWMSNLLNNVINFRLVIFTDKKSVHILEPLIKDNKNIKVILIEIEDFYTYKYKDYFISSHNKNILNSRVEWKLIMLWCEKISFVKKVIDNNYFNICNHNNVWYGWCDIGYFRSEKDNKISIDKLKYWPCEHILKSLYTDKIYYAQVCNDYHMTQIRNIISNNQLIPQEQFSVAGGFFLITEKNMDWWFETYYEKINYYINNNICIKDDQMILIHCINNNFTRFNLIKEQIIEDCYYDQGWFGFSSFLMNKNIDNTFISILLPINNVIEFIDVCIESIIKQTFVKWELIIGINGHPPFSEVYKIAKKYEDIDNRITVYEFSEDIKGKSSALNEMLKYCCCDWVSLIDVDDIWAHTKLEKQIPYLDKYDVIGTLCKYFGSCDIVPNIPVNDISDYNFLITNPIINSSSIIRKELCYWDGTYNLEDYDLFLRLWKQNKKFYNVDSIEVLHRIHNNSAFNSGNNKQNLEGLLKKHFYIKFI